MFFIITAVASAQGQLIPDEIFAMMTEYKASLSLVVAVVIIIIIIVILSTLSAKLWSQITAEHKNHTQRKK